MHLTQDSGYNYTYKNYVERQPIVCSNLDYTIDVVSDAPLYIPDKIDKPKYVGKKKYRSPYVSDVVSDTLLEKMREACSIVHKTLNFLEDKVDVGVSTGYLNYIAHNFICHHDAYPSPLLYNGFPKSICTSKNNVICHGIPDDNEMLVDGDIINIDVSVYKNGVHGDAARMYLVGDVSDEARQLVDKTALATYTAIKSIKPGYNLNVIGRTIENVVKPYGYGIVRDFGGHGINRELHTHLSVPHYYRANTDVIILENMVFTIEPMINKGSPWCYVGNDDWTVYTEDGELSAQFEHTVVIRKDGAEILT